MQRLATTLAVKGNAQKYLIPVVATAVALAMAMPSVSPAHRSGAKCQQGSDLVFGRPMWVGHGFEPKPPDADLCPSRTVIPDSVPCGHGRG